MRALVSLFLTLALVTGCQDDDPFTEVAYFRGDNLNRVFVLTAAPGTETRAVLDRAEALSYTAGRFTAVFVFEADAPPPSIQAVTLASDYLAAIDLIYSEPFSGWRWRFMHDNLDRTDWTDCRNPRGNDELCNP